MLCKNKVIFALLTIILLESIVQNSNATVVVSLKPLGFIVSAIADEVTDIQVLLPDGASEHNYYLRPSDVKCIQNAELVVWIGPRMEAFIARPLKQLLTAQKQVVIAELEEVNPLLMKHDNRDHYTHDSDEYNMHLWLSPKIAWLSAVAIYKRLVELIPQSKARLDANLRDFRAQLTAIDKQLSSDLASLKEKGYFVFHDAYSYYEKHYGLTPLGHFTINPEIQPGAHHLYEIRSQLMKQKATCIFTEPQFKPVIVKAIIRGTSARMGILDPLGTNIQLGKKSYIIFLNQLANQYASCLKGD